MEVTREEIEKTINILSTVPELERVKDFWINYQVMPASAASSSVNWLDEFVNFLSQDIQLIGLSIKTLVQNELKEVVASKSILFFACLLRNSRSSLYWFGYNHYVLVQERRSRVFTRYRKAFGT